MRLVLLTPAFPPRGGGLAITLWSALSAQALHEAGHEVHVIELHAPPPGQDGVATPVPKSSARVHRYDLDAARHLASPTPTASLRVATALLARAAVERIEPDCVITPEAYAFNAEFPADLPVVSRASLSWRMGRRFGARGVDSADVDATAHLRERALRSAHVAIVSTAWMLDQLVAEGSLPKTLPVQIVPDPLDLGTFAGVAPTQPTARRIVVLGRLEPQKAPERVLPAVARLGAVPGMSVRFVGRDGPTLDGESYRTSLALTAKDLGVDVAFVGPLPRRDVVRELSHARVVVVPSAFDNLPFAALEAMAAGRAVVASDTTGLDDLLDEARRVDAADPDVLAAALLPDLVDAARARRAGAALRAQVRSYCDPVRVAERLEEACRAACLGGRNPNRWDGVS